MEKDGASRSRIAQVDITYSENVVSLQQGKECELSTHSSVMICAW